MGAVKTAGGKRWESNHFIVHSTGFQMPKWKEVIKCTNSRCAGYTL